MVDGAVVVGGLDGRVYVFEARSGRLLATHDTAVAFETLNGVIQDHWPADALNVGFTDATFTAMKAIEGGRNAAWPF